MPRQGTIQLVCRVCGWEFNTMKRDEALKQYHRHADACQNVHGHPRIWVWATGGKSLFEGGK